MVAQRVALAGGRAFELRAAPPLRIAVAAEGLRRVRSMAMSPDGRVFLTDMHDKSDNRRGAIYILDRFDEASGRFQRVRPYQKRLRNPNSLAFVTDAAGRQWLYVALTDHLVRYRYVPGDTAPRGPAERIAAFPDSGEDPRRGGWHLTRTIAVGERGKLYVSVGSSCNACVERVAVRAVVLEMNLDGSAQRTVARGLRNAVGLVRANGILLATTMGVDHLGRDRPDDLLVEVKDGADFGWPACFESAGRVLLDSLYASAGGAARCRRVPRSVAAFPAHSAPIGVEWFDAAAPAPLARSFVVALHGSGYPSMQRGFSIVRVRPGTAVETVVDGFQSNGKVRGRPAFILRYRDGFLVTDDAAGVVYLVSAAVNRAAP